MINTIFLVGLILFAISSGYFYFAKKKPNKINSAFLVSFVTLTSYVLMLQGNFVTEAPNGQPIYWTRWLFYAISCSLLMLEISRVKQITSKEKISEIIFLNVVVMLTGLLAAISTDIWKWAFFVLSSIAYLIQISMLLRITNKESNWVNTYIYLGWSVFPIVFLLAPTGLAIINSTLAMALYLVLDLYTKIIFNLQLRE